MNKQMNGFSKSFIIALATILAALLVTAGLWLMFNRELVLQKPQSQNQTAVVGLINTSGWKTHINERYNFEFQYPKDLIVAEIADNTTSILTDLTEPGLFISVDKEPYTLLFQGTWGFVPYSQAKSSKIIFTENVVENGTSFIKDYWLIRSAGDDSCLIAVVYNTKNNGEYYSIYRGTSVNQKTLGFSCSAGETINVKVLQEILASIDNIQDIILLNQLVSTFKFTPPIQLNMVDWRTYTNSEYGFEIKYPKDWRVLDNKVALGDTLRLGPVTSKSIYCDVAENADSLIENYKKYNAFAGFEEYAINLAVSQNCSIKIKVEKNNDGLNLRDYLQKVYIPIIGFNNDMGLATSKSEAREKINNMDIIKFDGVEYTKNDFSFVEELGGIDGSYLTAYVIYGNSQYIVNNENYNVFITENLVASIDKKNTDTIFDRMISTFKFIK